MTLPEFEPRVSHTWGRHHKTMQMADNVESSSRPQLTTVSTELMVDTSVLPHLLHCMLFTYQALETSQTVLVGMNSTSCPSQDTANF